LVLVRLAYLAVSNAFAALRLLPMGDREKDIEILSLRHQVTVLQRSSQQPGPRSIRRTGRCLPCCWRHCRARHCAVCG
jgi:hypothetical protein